jgi:hypothetical protein
LAGVGYGLAPLALGLRRGEFKERSMDKLAVYLLFGFLTESLVEYIFSEWVGKWTKYISLVMGVVLASVYQLDLIQALTGLHVPIAGWVLTGFILGRGANYINDIIDFVRSYTERAS